MSVFFLPDKKVVYGLPVTPELFEAQAKEIKEEGTYSCGFCGYTKEMTPVKNHPCAVCKKTKWVKSINWKRVK
jgi:hypothetical protein